MKLHDIFQIVCREKFLILMAWLRQQTRFMQEPSEQCFATFLFLRERICITKSFQTASSVMQLNL